MAEIEILLVDDDPDDRELFQEALTKAFIPAKFTCLENGNQFSEFLTKRKTHPPPDVIFLDINMPNMNGKECLQKLRENNKFETIPVIIYSTSSDPRDVQETFNYGANLYIVKPSNFSHRITVVQKLFAEGWQQRLNNSHRGRFVFK